MQLANHKEGVFISMQIYTLLLFTLTNSQIFYYNHFYLSKFYLTSSWNYSLVPMCLYILLQDGDYRYTFVSLVSLKKS